MIYLIYAGIAIGVFAIHFQNNAEKDQFIRFITTSAYATFWPVLAGMVIASLALEINVERSSHE